MKSTVIVRESLSPRFRAKRIVVYLASALSAVFRCKAPLKVTLPMVKELRQGVPKMNKIWEASTLALSGRDDSFQPYFFFEEDALKLLADGTATEETCASPDTEQNDSDL